MINIYRTTETASGGIHLFVAIDPIFKSWSKPSSKLPTELVYLNAPDISSMKNWTHIGSVHSLPIDPSQYPELLI